MSNPLHSSDLSTSSDMEYPKEMNRDDTENQKEAEYNVSIKSIHSSIMEYAKSNGMKVGDTIESIRVGDGPDSFEHEVTNLDYSTLTLLNVERPITLTCSRKLRNNWLLLQYWWWDMLCCRYWFICPVWGACGSCVNDEDALAIGELLKTNNTLKTLDLDNNNITDVQSIGEGLKTNKTLQKSWLCHNNIIDVQNIGEELKTNNTLTTLHLGNNNITDDGGIQSIIDGLKTNNTLKKLYLHNNQLSDNVRSQLYDIIQYKRDG